MQRACAEDVRDVQNSLELWPQGPANSLPPGPYVMPATGRQGARDWLRSLELPSAAGLDSSRCFSVAKERAGRKGGHISFIGSSKLVGFRVRNF